MRAVPVRAQPAKDYTGVCLIMNVRAAIPEDAAAIAGIRVLTWQIAFRGIIPQPYLDAMDASANEAMWRASISEEMPRVLVAEAAGKVVGFSCFGCCRDEGASSSAGEIWALYVLPDDWDKGVGRQLWLESRRQLVEQGSTVISLWVLEKNLRAIRFYCAAGFAPDASSRKCFEIGGAQVPEIRYLHSVTSCH